MATNTAAPKDPWAWQAWAAQQDPKLYGFEKGQITSAHLAGSKKLLQQAGLWKPEWDAFVDAGESNGEGGGWWGPEPDVSSLKGYQLGQARGNDRNQLNAIFDPSGKRVAGDVSISENALRRHDYAQIAAVIGGGIAGGYGLANAGIGEGLAAATQGVGTLGTIAPSAATTASSALPTLGAMPVPTAASLGLGELATVGAGGLGTLGPGIGGAGGGYSSPLLADAIVPATVSPSITGLTAPELIGTGTLGTIPQGAGPSEMLPGTAELLPNVDPSKIGNPLPKLADLASGASLLDRLKDGAGTAKDWLQIGGALLPAVAGLATRPDAIDTSDVRGAAQANRRIGTSLEGLAVQQFDQLSSLFKEYEPILRQQIGTALADQDVSRGRSNDEWNDYVQTYRPVGQRLSAMALDMANPARKEQEAARAASDTTTQFDRARQDSRRALEQSGASQDKIASLEAAGRLSEAKAVGGVQGTARRDTESRAMQYLSGAANFGQNINRNSQNLSQLSDQQGNRAISVGNNTLEAASLPGRVATNIGQAAVGANNASGSLFSAANRDQSASDLARNNATLGGLAGTARLIGQLVGP